MTQPDEGLGIAMRPLMSAVEAAIRSAIKQSSIGSDANRQWQRLLREVQTIRREHVC
jgi:hypothetical protein